MKPQEIDRIESAIRHIQTAVNVDPWACKIAVEAMKKQIPMKPKRIDRNSTFDGNWKMVCPVCGFVFIERVTTTEESFPSIYRCLPYCKCGQAIEWTETEY